MILKELFFWLDVNIFSKIRIFFSKIRFIFSKIRFIFSYFWSTIWWCIKWVYCAINSFSKAVKSFWLMVKTGIKIFLVYLRDICVSLFEVCRDDFIRWWCAFLNSEFLKDVRFFFKYSYKATLGRFIRRSIKDIYHMFIPLVYNVGPKYMDWENTFQPGLLYYLDQAWTQHRTYTLKTIAYIIAGLIFMHFTFCPIKVFLSIIFWTPILVYFFGQRDLLKMYPKHWYPELHTFANEWSIFWNFVLWFFISALLHGLISLFFPGWLFFILKIILWWLIGLVFYIWVVFKIYGGEQY